MDNTTVTAKDLTFYKDFLDRFPGETVVKSETEADTQCTHPDHPDDNPSLGVDLVKRGGEAKIVVNCRSRGCDVDELLSTIGTTTRDLFFDKPSFGKSKKIKRTVPGCTLEEYAEAKKLPVEYLANGSIGLERAGYLGKPAVRIPYPDEGGEPVAQRFRVGLRKAKEGPDDRFRWETGNAPTLYGLHLLGKAWAAGYVLLVEGESDCHTAWFHDLPALGIPGSDNWRDEWATHLEGIPKILVCVETDTASEGMWTKISRCPALAGRVNRVVLDDAL